MQPRPPLVRGRALGAVLLAWLCLLAAAPAQDLLPAERDALNLQGSGEPRAAALRLLDLAIAEAADATVDAERAARIEAWASYAAEAVTGDADDAVLQKFVALRQRPLPQQMPLLADRLGMAELRARTDHPSLRTSTLPDELGVLRHFWLLGPFANERGAGFAEALPPERAVDLDAELPGKRRAVRWRALPRLADAAVVPLERLLQPSEQTLAYLLTAVHSEAAQRVVLELGSTGSVRVSCNGREVFARDVQRPFATDQDACWLPLQPGWNLLLLKVCHQEGPDFTFAARVRAADGNKAAVRTSHERSDLLAAITGPATRTPDASDPAAGAPLPLGGRSHWQIGAVHGADALRLAWLWAMRAADGDRDRRDAAAAEVAARELPQLPAAHLLVAFTQLRHARSAADRDDNDRRRALERALELALQHPQAHVQLGRLLLDGSRLWPSAREHALAALALAPRYAEAVLLYAETLRAEGLDQAADALIRSAATRDGASVALLEAAVARVGTHELPLAVQFREAVLQRRHDALRATRLATLRARTGDRDGAVALLRAELAHDPLALPARHELVDLLLALGNAAAAAELLDAWLQIAPDDTGSLLRAATCQRLLATHDPDANARQLDLLRSALQVEPNRRDTERYAEFVAASATSGSAEEATTFQAPFQIDAKALVAADPGAPEDAAAANDPLHWLLRQQVIRANGNGTTNTYQHVIVRVLNADGARSLASYRLPAYQGEQRARLLSCTVFRADGSIQRPPLQGASVRMPDLRPGDVVALEGRIDDLAPTFFGDYFGLVHSFESPDGSPVRASELVVLAAPGREYHLQERHGAPTAERTTTSDGTLQLRWRMRDLPRDQPEVRRPDGREYEPLVRISTYRDWQQFAAWWWNLIEPQLEVSPTMRETVARVCQGLDDTEAKIRAIYHFVTTDVRYEAWEFGVHGYKPYSTAIIHERRHGDCKDKALLLCALLAEIGVPCHPVLIFADPLRTTDDLTLPMVQHFNHCIAWLPEHAGKPGRFLDGTAVWHPTDTLPDMDQGAAVLVVERGQAELRQVPWTTPTANVLQTEHTLELRSDGTARLTTTEQPRGNRAVELRAMLATEPARRAEVLERSLVARFGKLKLVATDAEAPPSPEAPVQIGATADLAEIGQRTGTSWQLPSSWADDELLALATDEQRVQPLLLGVPNGDLQRVRYRLPAGWRAGELPAPVQLETSFGSFRMRWTRQGSEVLVERELRLVAPRIAPSEHRAFREFVSAVRAADAKLVLLQSESNR
ncbi:MAG: DUF3857 domain-containing protein [Planctomycetes bacterium]|nr:DUF3857 domain-containing protein [Planctomycetota bacterium]